MVRRKEKRNWQTAMATRIQSKRGEPMAIKFGDVACEINLFGAKQLCCRKLMVSHMDRSPTHIQPNLEQQLPRKSQRQAVKRIAANEIFTSAAEIVNKVPIDFTLCSNITHCQKMRPAEPTDLEFEGNENHIPEDFLKSDLKIDGRRHLVFVTQSMLDLLSKSKTWYVDGTFKVVKEPFTQLFTIHSLVRSRECGKQVPLAFVLMSGKRKWDY